MFSPKAAALPHRSRPFSQSQLACLCLAAASLALGTGYAAQDSMLDHGADLSALPKVPKGYSVQLFAKEPLVRQTCSMAFDARGRLFVGMGPQYRDPTPQTPGDSVVIITDTDGDGRADKSHTFATGLNCVQGLAWRGDELWIANAPDLTRVRDTDGDDIADEYTKIFTDLGNLEHGLHGLVWAPDGMLYMSKGNSKGLNDPKLFPTRLAPKPFRELFGQSVPAGTPDFPKPQTFTAADYQHTYQDPKDDWGLMGGVLRCQRDGSGLEIVARGMRNPWDIAHDDGFHWLCTDNDQSDGDRVMMPFMGAHFGWNHPWSSSWTGEAGAPTVPLSHDVFTGSGTGMVFGSLGGHERVFFINDWLRKTTFVFQPQWDGALMRAKGGQWQAFVEGGHALYRPVDMAFGPDGALWCLSWSRGYGAEVKDGQMVSEGRVYRIIADNAKAPRLPTKPLAKRSIAELVDSLHSPLPVHRIDARDELLRWAGKGDAEMAQMLRSGTLDSNQQTWVAWSLLRGNLLASAITDLLSAAPGNLQTQAIRIVGAHGRGTPLKPGTLAALLKLLSTGDARVRFEVVQCLARRAATTALPSLQAAMDQEPDRIVFYTMWQALRSLAGSSELKAMLSDSRANVRRAALLALLEDGALSQDEVKPLAADKDDATRRTAADWLSIMRGEGPRAKVKDRGIDTTDLAPLEGEAPQLTPPPQPSTVDAAMALLPQANPERGRLLALHPQGAGCVACHRIEGRGLPFGPELTGIGSRAEPRHLVQSMLEPSAVITEGFNMQVITTKSATLSGVLLEESGVAITLGLAGGQRARVMRADVVKRETLPISAMPPFTATLDAQACADITAWLMSRVDGAKPKLKDKPKSGDKNKDRKKDTDAHATAPITGLPESPLITSHGDAAKGFSLDHRQATLALRIDGKVFATQVLTHPQIKRPFIAQVCNRAGTQLTRNFPPRDGDATDHADMHPGLWLSFGGVNGSDFWRGKARVEVTSVTDIHADHDGLGYTLHARWLSTAGKPLCQELTRITASTRQADGGITLRWRSQLSSADQALTFDGQEEAGLGIRMATRLAVKSGGGHILSSTGAEDEKQCWGRIAQHWRYGTDSAAITVKPIGREHWAHARDYGALVINPTGLPDENKRPKPFTMQADDKLILEYELDLEGR